MICPQHPATTLVCPACNGAKGGRVLSDKKLAQLRQAAKKPRKPKQPESYSSS